MYALRKDTLAGIKQSALFEARRINPPVGATILKLNDFMSGADSNVVPEGEALKFYFANHVFSLIAARYDPNEPLPEKVAELARGYVKLASDLVVRLAYYTLLIITREARHFHGPDHVIDSIHKECGKEIGAFCKSILGESENGAVSMLRHSPVAGKLEPYIRAMTKIFNEGSWSGAFGGPKWGNIAETLRKMVVGETSAEMFADTAFTLAHNGGPMFNKGMLYSMWGKYLYRILDVQRSGQIPQLIAQENRAKELLDSATSDYVALARKVFPVDLGGHVDWFKVEALGALHTYEDEKKKQVALGHLSKYVKVDKAQFNAITKNAEVGTKYYVGVGAEDYAVIVPRQAAA